MWNTPWVLILLRHGRTPANAEGLLQGRLDQDLDEVGLEQAAAAFEFISGTGAIDAVVASPLKRAQQTAGVFGMPIETDDRWMEMSFGEYEGMPYREVPRDVWRRWRDDPDFTPAGGESLASVDIRVRSACSDLAERAETSNIVVVSHVTPMKAAVAWVLDVADISATSHLDQAAICRVSFRGGRPVLTTFNETAPPLQGNDARGVVNWG